MKIKTINLQHLDMISAQTEMVIIRREHKKSGSREVLNFLLPRDRRSNSHKIFSKQPLHEEISEATDRD